jgi:hypothetical protein
MVQGDDFIEPIVLEDGAGNEIDLEGYEFKSQLRRTADNGLVAEFDLSLLENIVTRKLSASLTAGLDGTYVHDFQWTDPDGNIRTLFSGRFEIQPEVTR